MSVFKKRPKIFIKVFNSQICIYVIGAEEIGAEEIIEAEEIGTEEIGVEEIIEAEEIGTEKIIGAIIGAEKKNFKKKKHL